MSFSLAKRQSNDKKKKNSKQELLPLQEHVNNALNNKGNKKVAFQSWGFTKKKIEFEDDSDTESLFTFSTISRKATVRRRGSGGSFSLSEGDLTGLFKVSVDSDKGNDQLDGSNTAGNLSLQVIQAIEEGDSVALRYLLERGADPNQQIGVYRVTPIYVAADRGLADCVRVLLEFGASPDPVLSRDGTVERKSAPISPLRLAARKNYIEVIKALLEHGADVNGTENGIQNSDVLQFVDAPLHKAAANNACGALVELIKAGAVVDIRDGRGRTPLLHAAANAQISAMKILLEFGANPNAKDLYGTTALLLVGGQFITTRKNTKRKNTTGYCEAVTVLLSYGATSTCVDPDTLATPLHQAVTLGDVAAVKEILSTQHPVNCQDKEGVTPLHIAALKGNAEIMQLLIQQTHDPIKIDIQDTQGRTAIHKAAFRGSIDCIKLLVEAGADLSRTTGGGNSAIKLILSMPNGAQYLEDIMDDCIHCNDVSPSERNFRIRFVYSLLLSEDRRNQTCTLNEILEVPERRIGGLLEHPLIESFLTLKWQKVKYLYFAKFFMYIVLVLGLTGIISFGFCSLKDGDDLSQFETMKILQLVLLGFHVFVTFQELLQMVALRNQYFREVESILKIALLTTSFVLLVVKKKYDWILHVAAVSVFFGWAELMMLVGRLPTLGVYTLMFSSVAQNIIKFLFAFSFLLIGFAISFHVLFQEESFENIFIGILRTLGMMTGDSEFEQRFFPEKADPPPPGSSHVIYALFLILVSIVLMNLLIGLAVSDIHGLLKVGRLKRLRKQGRYLIYLETAAYSRVFSIFIPRCLWDKLSSRLKLDKEICVYPSSEKRNTVSLPGHIYENAIKICQEKKCKRAPSVSDVLEATNDCKDRIFALTKAVNNCGCDCGDTLRKEFNHFREEVSDELKKINIVLQALAVKHGIDSTEA